MCAINQLPYGLKLKIWRGKQSCLLFFLTSKRINTLSHLEILGFAICLAKLYSFRLHGLGEKCSAIHVCTAKLDMAITCICDHGRGKKKRFFIRSMRHLDREGIAYTQYLIMLNYTPYFHNMDICLKCLISCMNYFRY